MESTPTYVLSTYTNKVMAMIAISDPGIFLENLGVIAMIMILAMLIIVFHQLMVSK
ncbi:hypothetical protein SDC9_83990 [bioreactor metagenome]|uniref:Uncharacterized protein n=1 Tax=bioreactor metagenome TaxID=1076179 RepID=A0A644Z9M7_9ZZZZ